MPRIFASNEAHNCDQGAVDFANGVAALPIGTDVTRFAAPYVVDQSKHALTTLDSLTIEELRAFADYMAVTRVKTVGEDTAVPLTKYELTRAIETALSTAKLAAITVTSVAGTLAGDTNIVTDPTTAPLRYKAAATAPAPLYMDDVSDWTAVASGADITVAAGLGIRLVRVDASGHVLASGTAIVITNIDTLVVASAAGTNSGDTKLTITPAEVPAGCTLKVKTGAGLTLPVSNAVLTTGWAAWNGVLDVTATTGQDIIVAVVDATNKAKAAGKATVASKP